MVAVLDQDHETVEDAAKAVLEAAQRIISERSKFTVVAQIKPQGDKVALGQYPTEKQALNHALALTISTQTHEEARAWVLPIHDDTPASWYKKRKGERVDSSTESFRIAELRRREKWFEENPGETPPPEWTVFIPFESETDQCDHCKGLGRVPKPELKTYGERE